MGIKSKKSKRLKAFYNDCYRPNAYADCPVTINEKDAVAIVSSFWIETSFLGIHLDDRIVLHIRLDEARRDDYYVEILDMSTLSVRWTLLNKKFSLRALSASFAGEDIQLSVRPYKNRWRSRRVFPTGKAD